MDKYSEINKKKSGVKPPVLELSERNIQTGKISGPQDRSKIANEFRAPLPVSSRFENFPEDQRQTSMKDISIQSQDETYVA